MMTGSTRAMNVACDPEPPPEAGQQAVIGAVTAGAGLVEKDPPGHAGGVARSRI